MMRTLQWMAFFLLVKTVIVVGDYSLQITLTSFSNPEERNADGECCVNNTLPRQGVCPSPCNTTLWICVQDINAPPNDITCPLGMGIIPQSLNSLTIFSQGAWPGSVQLAILILDDQSETLGALVPGSPVPPGDLIDVVYVSDVSIVASSPQSSVMEYSGNLSRATMGLSFQVMCAANFFGPDCNTACQGRDDDALGHFTCDPANGNMICLPGYQNLAVNCTECVPLEGCSSIGGFCVDPGDCICRSGYFGDLCTENANSSINTPSPTATVFATDNFLTTSALLTEQFSISPSPSISGGILTSTPNIVTSLRSTTSLGELETSPLPTNVPTGGVGTRTSNSRIVWITVSITVGTSIIVAVSATLCLAAAYSHRKGCFLQKKRQTGSQFFGLIYNVNSNNLNLTENVPETLNNARDASLENNAHAQTNDALMPQSGLGVTVPEATYSTFQDGGHYSIKRLYTDDEPDYEEANGSVFTNSVAVQTATPLHQEKKDENFVPKFDSLYDTMDPKDEFLEPDFKIMMDEGPFHAEEPILGNDLLNCIEESLSHSSQANNYFPGMIAAFSTTADTNEEKLTAESDFAPSFIYADHIDEGPNAVDDNEFCLPSVSPE